MAESETMGVMTERTDKEQKIMALTIGVYRLELAAKLRAEGMPGVADVDNPFRRIIGWVLLDVAARLESGDL